MPLIELLPEPSQNYSQRCVMNVMWWNSSCASILWPSSRGCLSAFVTSVRLSTFSIHRYRSPILLTKLLLSKTLRKSSCSHPIHVRFSSTRLGEKNDRIIEHTFNERLLNYCKQWGTQFAFTPMGSMIPPRQQYLKSRTSQTSWLSILDRMFRLSFDRFSVNQSHVSMIRR